MNIGIDMDGVMIDDDRYILDNLSKFLYEKGLPEMENPTVYEEKFNLDADENLKYREEYFFNYIENAKPFDYTKEVIDKLHEKGHKIVVITGRFKTTSKCELGEKMRFLTENWLRKNKIYYDKIVYSVIPKIKEVEENNIDLMLEDSPYNIPLLARVTKVACFNTQYNQHIDLPNVTRVFSWYDFLSKFEKYLEK